MDSSHLASAGAAARERLGVNPKLYHDWRELVHDPDVDVVHIATSPHWHGIMSIEAARAGKDIFCEKPMTRTIGESIRVMEAVKRGGNVFRLNTWFRFKDTFYGLGTEVKPLKKLIDSKVLGWPLKIRISGANGFAWKFYWTGKENLEPQSVPPGFDYDMWLGPAPYKPYNIHRTHSTFRGYWDYDGGGLADMGQHYLDPVQYMLGKDDEYPVKVEVDAPQQHPDACGIWRSITYTYADGCQIILEGEGFESKGKVPYLEGPDGAVYQGFECTVPHVWDIINDTLDHDDPIYAGLREYQVHGSAYGIIPARRMKHKPVGEWSTEEIEVRGTHIKVTVNGEVILDGDLREACQGHNVAPDGSAFNPFTTDHHNHPGMFNSRGHISFCGHGNGLQFRNIRILDLSR